MINLDIHKIFCYTVVIILAKKEENMDNFLKKNRAIGLTIVALIYVLAALLSIYMYTRLTFATWLNLLIADVIGTLTVFIFSVLFDNASVYDPYWSIQPIVILTALFISCGFSVSGLFILIAVILWGIRLTANWVYTFGGLGSQDWRYTMLEEKSGAYYPLVNFFGIHLVPTLVVYAATLPAVYIIENKTPFNIGVLIFAIIAILAATLQGVADYQLHKFRKANKNARKPSFIRVGLWKNSRHPNYLGEILMWWAVALAGVCASYWYLIGGAILNTLLFMFISIPMADKHQSRKKNFNNYKKDTRALLPFKK